MNTDALFHAIDSIKEDFNDIIERIAEVHSKYVVKNAPVTEEWLAEYVHLLCKKYQVSKSLQPYLKDIVTDPFFFEKAPFHVNILVKKLKELIAILPKYDEEKGFDCKLYLTELQVIALTNDCSDWLKYLLVCKELTFDNYMYDEVRELRNTLLTFNNDIFFEDRQYYGKNIEDESKKKFLSFFQPNDFSFLRNFENTQAVYQVAETIAQNFSTSSHVRQESFYIMMALLEFFLPDSFVTGSREKNLEVAERIFRIEEYSHSKAYASDVKREIKNMMDSYVIGRSILLEDWEKLYQEVHQQFKANELGCKYWDLLYQGEVNTFYLSLYNEGCTKKQLYDFFFLKLKLDYIKDEIQKMRTAYQQKAVAEELQPIPQQADEEQALYDTNIIFKCRVGDGQMDLLKLNKYIKEKFVAKKRYHWAGLFLFLERARLLAKTSYEAFSKQMNSEEWFKDCTCSCSADSIGDYKMLRDTTILPSNWIKIDTKGSKMSKSGIKEIKELYDILSLGFSSDAFQKVK